MLVWNISDNFQIVSWIPSFNPEEIREVTQEEWELLLRNPNFKEFVKEDESSSKKTWKKSK